MKYIRAFFNFLGFLTFVAMLGAATFWFIGYQKNKVHTSSVTFKDITLTPVKTEEVTTTDSHETFPDFKPISRPAAPDKLVEPRRIKPAAKPTVQPAKKAVSNTVPAVKPVTYVKKPKTIPAAPATRVPKKRPAKALAKPATHTELSPCTLVFRATDNGASPRTGRGIVNVAETTELERAVIRRLNAEKELRDAASQIRNPPVWESGVVKFFSQNK